MSSSVTTQPSNEKQQRLSEKLLPEIETFKQRQQSLMLATVDNHQQPNVSYTPYALANGSFYILISDLAKHGRNLKNHPQLSVMMVEDEQQAQSIFARKRLTFEVKARLIDRSDSEFAVGIQALTDRLGEMAEQLAKLADFNLYQLTPQKGLFVKGFAQAFEISGEDLTAVTWASADGHGHQSISA